MKHIHFIGICGKGMSALALMMKEKGFIVTGSDEGSYEPIASHLRGNGIDFATSHSAENIPSDADTIVIGRHAKLVPESNEEVRAALDSGKTIYSLPQGLQELTQDMTQVVVAGSYGKSTVTSLIAHVLKSANKKPSYFIGALSASLPENGHIDTGDICVIEGDEYPSANFDEKSKFLHFTPETIVLTSLTHDHVNIFPNFEDYKKPFVELLRKSSVKNRIANIDSLEIQDTLNNIDDVVWYGFSEDAEFSAQHIQRDEQTSFTLTRNGTVFGNITTNMVGDFSIHNILGCAAYIFSQTDISFEDFASAIASFSGLRRRLEKIEGTRVPTYENFGSSLEKHQSGVESLQKHFPDKRIICLFEPHTFSWRNKNMIHWYKEGFSGISELLVYPPPSHGADSHEQLTIKEIYDAIKDARPELPVYLTGKEDIIPTLNDILTDDTILLVSTSGGFDGILPLIYDSLQN